MLSGSCKYAIRAVILIGSKSGGDYRVGLKVITDELNVPQPYLAKILQVLVKRKLLHSTKGPHGGFRLYKNASDLTLMDIVRAIDGEDFFDCCYLSGKKCNFNEPEKGVCTLHNDLRKERERLTKYFSSKSIEGIIKHMNRASNVKF